MVMMNSKRRKANLSMEMDRHDTTLMAYRMTGNILLALVEMGQDFSVEFMGTQVKRGLLL